MGCASAMRGVDVSSAVYPSHWTCMKNDGYDFAVIRACRSSGSPDPVAPHTIYNAVSGGLSPSNIDVYMFPDPHRSSAASQVKSMLDYLNSYNCQCKWSGRIWLDIEDTASHSYWGSDTSANRQWATELLVAAVNAVGHDKVGIYASRYMWSQVFGSYSWDLASSYPLWCADYDGQPNLSCELFGGCPARTPNSTRAPPACAAPASTSTTAPECTPTLPPPLLLSRMACMCARHQPHALDPRQVLHLFWAQLALN